MFGSTLAGRPVQLATQIEQLRYTMAYPSIDANSITHLSIFMLPGVKFDPEYTALIYFQIQNQDGTATTDFQLLGALDINKQSAIFKINPGNIVSKPQVVQGMLNDIDMDQDQDQDLSQITDNLLIGISIEPNSQAILQLESLRQKQMVAQKPMLAITDSSVVSTGLNKEQIAQLANKIVTNAYNFLGGFIDESNKVPMKKFDDWWNKFKAKLANDPSFLDNLS